MRFQQLLKQLQKYVLPLQAGHETIILFCLWVFLIRCILSLPFMHLPLWPALGGGWLMKTAGMAAWIGYLLTIPLLAAQIYAFVERKKIVWILSAIQVLLVLLLSMGTFGFLITYIFAPFSHYQILYAVLVSIFLIGAEAGKTVYFYRVCKQ